MAVGSGHFLLRAAHRIARHLARVRSGEEEPSPAVYRTALRDVIGHCLYGVDINPMAVELCKVTLWLEALEPGKPLSFLDHHIRCGNSLLGTTPELIRGGIPDEAYEAIEGDDKEACSALKKKNKRENPKLGEWFIADEAAIRDRLYKAAAAIDEMIDSRPEDIRRKETAFRNAQQNYDFGKAWDLANLWCAAFVVKKRMVNGELRMESPPPATADVPPLAIRHSPFATQTDMFEGPATSLPAKAKRSRPLAIRHSPLTAPWGITTQHLRDFVEGGVLPEGLLAEVKRLAEQYQFFHFHLAFPEVSAQGGFDVSLGNPPWEHAELKEREWFMERRPHIAAAATASARKLLIASLIVEDPNLHETFFDALRKYDGSGAVITRSGLYPLCGRGRINLYAVFAERIRNLLRPEGRFGAIMPSGIATDDTTKFYFQDLVRERSLVSLFDFANSEGLFAGVDRNTKFCLLTSGRMAKASIATPQFVFSALKVNDLSDLHRRFTLTAEDIALFNPNTHTCPIFRSNKDAELNKSIYRRWAVLALETSDNDGSVWNVRYKQGLFNMAADSNLFRTSDELLSDGYSLVGNRYTSANETYLPLYEGKMMHQYDHRFAHSEKPLAGQRIRGSSVEISDAEHRIPSYYAQPRYWVAEKYIDKEFPNLRCLIAFRDVTGTVANIRTVVATVLGRVATGNKAPLLVLPNRDCAPASFIALINSLIFDYLTRQKLTGLSLNYYILKQIPVVTPSVLEAQCSWSADARVRDWLLPRVLELTYTAWDLETFAQDCLDVENTEWGMATGAEGYVGYWQRYSRHSPFTTHHSPPPPFRWDENRRFLLRCELDAAFFHLYLPPEANGEWRMASGETPEDLARLKAAFPTPRAAVSYILDTFPIVKRKDEAKFNGDYRTKRVILEIYDALSEAMRANSEWRAANGEVPAKLHNSTSAFPYRTRLDPPPADPRCCHPPKSNAP